MYSKISAVEILRRKSKMIGSDDIRTALNICKWSAEGGLKGSALITAEALAQTFEEVLLLSTRNNHYEAGKKSKSIQYILQRNSTVANLIIPCRDGKNRHLIEVLSWFSGLQFKIAKDIEEAEQLEAIQNAKLLEIKKIRVMAENVHQRAMIVANKLKVA